MGGRQIRPARVVQRFSQELKHDVFPGHRTPEPPWFKVMNAIPPSETLIRPIPVRHQNPNPKATKPKNLYRPQKIEYLEDSLRNTFFKDHPWELARPRVVVELDGMDARRCDWSKGLRQPGVALTGECVVQRQLWLMENEKMPKDKAYDAVRREFYRLRQQEDIERRIAVEEAKHVGAYFGKRRLDVGMLLEDKEFENWKIWAGKEAADREARHSSDVETFDVEEEPTEAANAST